VELNWSTFVLEIINFLVLLWILQRFLYRPVLAVIARRREAIAQQLATAKATQDQAAAVQAQYEGRLAEWESERAKARAALEVELDGMRTERLAELHGELEREREKTEVAGERQHAERQRAIEHEALRQAAAFASKLLGRASGPELEARLVDLVLEQLSQLPEERLVALRHQWGEMPARVEVRSAYELPEDRRRALEQGVHALAGPDVPVHFGRDADLLAGLEIEIGAWVLAGNVRDELRAFAEFAHAPR
jgi:F-type H+-transporting ATPase subunit b